jgi:O-antigen/teichoic acid export membrane protein
VPFLRNATSILASDAVSRGSTFLLYVMVGRYLGERQFGQLALALALFYAFQVLAGAGLKVYITRQVARDPEQTDQCLVSGSAVAAAFALSSIGATFAFVSLLGYPSDTKRVVLLLSFALLPFALCAVCEAVFQGRERMHYIVQATLPANVLKIAVALALLETGHGLEAVVAVALASYIAVLLIEWLLLLRHITKPRLAFSLRRSIAIGRASGTFLGVDALVAVMVSVNVLLLSKLRDERAVGMYSAAAQLMVPVALVYQNAALAVFPLMSRRIETAFEDVTVVAQRLGEFLMALGWFVVVALVVLAAPALTLVYGPGFQGTADALRVMAWSLLLMGLTATFGQILYARGQERLNLRLVAINAVVTLLVGIPLVAQWGVTGAAVALLTTRLLDFALHYAAVSPLMRRFDLRGIAIKPAIAAACAAPVLAAAAPHSALTALALGAVVYIAVLLVLASRSAGGLRHLKARYVDMATK